MKRRDLLKQMAAVGGLYAFQVLPLQKAFAQLTNPSKKHFFVLIRIYGGWDVSLSLDPKIHDGTDQNDIFIEYRPEDIFRFGDLALGPAASPLIEYHKDIMTLNGVHMRRDGGHDVNLDYISSGKGDGQTPSLAVELSALIAHQSHFDVGSLKSSPDMGYRKVSQYNALDLLSGSVPDSALELDLASEQNDDFSRSFRAFKNSLPDLKKTTEELKTAGKLAEEYKAEILALLLKNGIFNFVEIEQNPNIDTHTDHAGSDGVPGTHWRNQQQGWEEVARYFKVFKATPFENSTLFDHTTFMVVSEFARTPYLNSAKGKDHNPNTNSVLLAGKGINGGSSIGESKVYSRKQMSGGFARQVARPIDYKTGEIYQGLQLPESKSVNLIFPEDVARTVAGIFGDPEGFNNASLSRPVIPGVIKR